MSLTNLREINSHARMRQTNLREAELMTRIGQAGGEDWLLVIVNRISMARKDVL
ncbi:hypothetical protein [Marinifilum sp. N1E240]|uniref:hypothetical protein n=1 Tax=Marinifilum sp. N1E240 TaxID=2608082 RepID=UPI00186B8DBA|nr:hypothetical protein [Marinifilum sp. N1E240]